MCDRSTQSVNFVVNFPSGDSKEKSIGNSKDNSQLLCFTSSHLQEKNEITPSKDWSIMGWEIRTFEEHLEAAEKMPLWICTRDRMRREELLGTKQKWSHSRGPTPERIWYRWFQKTPKSRTSLGRCCPGDTRTRRGIWRGPAGPFAFQQLSVMLHCWVILLKMPLSKHKHAQVYLCLWVFVPK